MRKIHVGLLVLALLMLASIAQAQNPVQNPSFETGNLTNWVGYGYDGQTAVPAVKTVGPGGFDVLYPDQGASDGVYVTGYQAWGITPKGGMYQTFTATQAGYILIAQRAFSITYGFTQQDLGNRVRAAVVSGAQTSRTAVSAWAEGDWGAAYSDIILPVGAAGTYTLFIESVANPSGGICSTLWDNVRFVTSLLSFTTLPTVTSVGETTATIEWDTDAEGTTVLRYDTNGPPYDFEVSDAPGTHHAVTLTGLNPGQKYHFQAETVGALATVTSNDLTFMTVPAPQAQLTNGDFEAATLAPWYKFGPTSFDGLLTSPTFGVLSHGGAHMVGAISSYDNSKSMGGVFQRVAVTPGKTYAASVWIWTQNGNAPPYGPAYVTQCRIGIDPTGGIDPDNAMWSDWDNSQDWALPYDQLGYKQVTAMATVPNNSTSATIFLQVQHLFANQWLFTVMDDVTLQEAIPVNSLGAAKDSPVGSIVELPSALVTKSESLKEGALGVESWFCWVQEDDRSAGMKVRLTNIANPASIERGARIALNGRTSRKNLTDFYAADTEMIADSVTVLSTGNADPTPLDMTNKALGGAVSGVQRGATDGKGANNVGLLVKTTGKVVSVPDPYALDEYSFYIDDGSAVPNPSIAQGVGIKCWEPIGDYYYWVSPPAEGANVAVTGVSCLEVYDPTPGLDNWPDGSGDEYIMPTVRMRDGRDLQILP